MSATDEVTVVPKRIGGSLAIFLPAEVVRREDLRPGVPVRIVIQRPDRSAALGLLKGKGKFTPFDRHQEGLWPED